MLFSTLDRGSISSWPQPRHFSLISMPTRVISHCLEPQGWVFFSSPMSFKCRSIKNPPVTHGGGAHRVIYQSVKDDGHAGKQSLPPGRTDPRWVLYPGRAAVSRGKPHRPGRHRAAVRCGLESVLTAGQRIRPDPQGGGHRPMDQQPVLPSQNEDWKRKIPEDDVLLHNYLLLRFSHASSLIHQIL